MANRNKAGGLTTKDFEALGLPFEAFLRYCQLPREVQKEFERAARVRMAEKNK